MQSIKKHYTWQEDFTYDADFTMVLGQRNDGKTFGLREQFLRDYRDKKERFSTVVRHEKYISSVANNYFTGIVKGTQDAKLKEWFKDLNTPVFRLTNSTYQMAPRLKSGKPANKWETIGYFTSLAIKQDAKERTYEDVRRIWIDEALIEPEDLRYRSYLPNEWGNLSSLVTSMSKQRLNIEHKVSVYLTGNTVDVLNPYFKQLKIYTIPDYGRKWYNAGDKKDPISFLLHLLDPAIYEPYIDDAQDLGARMARSSGNADAYTNTFSLNMNEFIAKKTRSAKYDCGFIYHGKIYALWTDYTWGLQYISSRFVKGLNRPMYALTTQDNRVNYFAAKEAKKALQMLIDNYSMGIVRFENVELREGMFRLFRDFGVR